MNQTEDLNGQDEAEDLTKDLTASDKLDLVLVQVGDINKRLTRLEAGAADTTIRLTRLETIAENRSRDTAPMLGRVHKEIADTRQEMNERFTQLDHKINRLAYELVDLRAAHNKLDGRVSVLEKAA